ncbi:MAG: NAD-dependent epimerase/dehydratase family protein [Pararhizobium sp.]
MQSGTILVTGVAGFIGYHVARRLFDLGYAVVGVDSMNAYYDPALKEARLAELRKLEGFRFERVDLADRAACEALFTELRPEGVVHLAAQPGVRYSIDHPHAYGESNLTAFLNVLEGARHNGCRHLVYASSSSVYGMGKELPYSTDQNVDRPVSLYAATKKANELMAHAYSHLYRIPMTGLRFFTVYGPWGRPDMAVWSFTEAIKAGRPIKVFNHGDMRRDFTYIDDIAEGVVRVLAGPPADDGAGAPSRLYNIGNNRPEPLLGLIETLERLIGRPAKRKLLPMQPGDVYETYADISALERDFGFKPATPLETGLARFVAWHDAYAGRSRAA